MQKGFKRDGKGMAVLRFFTGLVVLLTALGLLYYFVVMWDYSDRIADPEYTLRPYVASAVTPSPTPTAEPTSSPTRVAGPTPTLPPYATPTPTPDAPTSAPTPAPTPEPTAIPRSLLSKASTLKAKDAPALSSEIRAGLSSCYVSAVDDYSLMEIDGYAYADNAAFDGLGADTAAWLIVTRDSTSDHLAYETQRVEGLTGIDHEGAGSNLAGADFRAVIDVSKYTDDVYSLGLILRYKSGDKNVYGSYKYDAALTFAVHSGEVISPVRPAQ